jgi:hypothetical protein
MRRFAVMMVLVAGATGVLVAASETGEPRKRPLRDGHVLLGARGIVRPTEDKRWVFIPAEPLTDGRRTIAENTPIELLRSNPLEKMAALFESGRQTLNVWMTARVTLYRGVNYLYAVHFVPTRTAPVVPAEPEPTEATAAADPNEPSILPDHIRQRLRPDVVLDLEKLPQMLEGDRDVAMVGRTGYFTDAAGKRTFVLDGFGRKIEGLSFHMLPDTVLQRTEAVLDASPQRMRFRVSGIVTRYNNEYYLLLQRAVRTYTHGNFR